MFLKVDVDEVRAVASASGVRCARSPAPCALSLADHSRSSDAPRVVPLRAMPTFQFFVAGAKVEDFAGADERRIEATLLKHGAKAAPPPPPSATAS